MIRVCILFSQIDKKWVENVRKQLAMFQRIQKDAIAFGEEAFLESADAYLIFLSSELFTSSVYIRVERALEREQLLSIPILPVLVSQCSLEYTSFIRMQCIPRNGVRQKYLRSGGDEVAYEVSGEIVRFLKDCLKERA